MITFVINYDYNLTLLLIISSGQVSLNKHILIILELYGGRQSYVADRPFHIKLPFERFYMCIVIAGMVIFTKNIYYQVEMT